MMRRLLASAAILAGLGLVGPLAQAAPEVVDGPGYLPECFAPWSDEITYFQWEAREGPFKIALVNGFVGNTWRIQMIQTAKAFVEQEGIKEHISDFRVISTGTDAAAQLGAIEDFINQGFDAIITIAVSPEGFDRVIRLADRNNVVLVPFDNILDTDAVMMVNEDQFAMHGETFSKFIPRRRVVGRDPALEFPRDGVVNLDHSRTGTSPPETDHHVPLRQGHGGTGFVLRHRRTGEDAMDQAPVAHVHQIGDARAVPVFRCADQQLVSTKAETAPERIAIIRIRRAEFPQSATGGSAVDRNHPLADFRARVSHRDPAIVHRQGRPETVTIFHVLREQDTVDGTPRLRPGRQAEKEKGEKVEGGFHHEPEGKNAIQESSQRGSVHRVRETFRKQLTC